MLIEQAFFALPEFLCGLQYDDYEYEGTLVMAFAMSVLQELNARNINYPISRIRGEVSYPSATDKRADIHLNYESLNILTPSLAKYGMRRQNWLEAKFFKTNDEGKPTVDSTRGLLLLIKDLLRIVILPPEPEFSEPESARYLLHVYDGNPEVHLSSRRNKTAAVKAYQRDWSKHIVKAGAQSLDAFRFSDEVGQFDTVVGKAFRDVELSLKVLNFVFLPSKEDHKLWHLVLTRIERAEVKFKGHRVVIDHDKIKEDKVGDLDAIQKGLSAEFAV